MRVFGYLRVSTAEQDLIKQEYLLLTYARANKLHIDEMITVKISATKTQAERKINEIFENLNEGDILLVAELSRLGRNMLEVLNLIEKINEAGIILKFVRQPELSTDSSHTKLLLAIYGYFAQAEREFISLRTKQGLLAAKSSGKKLGRPKGSKSKKGRVLDSQKQQIQEYLKLGLSINAISKIINNQLESPLSYNSYWNYIKELNTVHN